MTERLRVAFFASDKDREQELARCFLGGAKKHGCKISQRALSPDEPDFSKADVAAMVGVKSKRLFDAAKAAGVVPIMLDKGYVRTRRAGSRVWEYWRVAVGAHHPTAALMRRKFTDERLRELRLHVNPWHRNGTGSHIVVAGSSAKYHAFYALPEPNDYYRDLVAAIRARTDRPIVYRPKPSYRDAEPIEGTRFSGDDETINDALWGAHCLVTHGSNACFEAALTGVPSIILGDGVALPISDSDLDRIEDPECGKRDQWLANLAHFQWTEAELINGLAWPLLAELIDEARS